MQAALGQSAHEERQALLAESHRRAEACARQGKGGTLSDPATQHAILTAHLRIPLEQRPLLEDLRWLDEPGNLSCFRRQIGAAIFVHSLNEFMIRNSKSTPS